MITDQFETALSAIASINHLHRQPRAQTRAEFVRTFVVPVRTGERALEELYAEAQADNLTTPQLRQLVEVVRDNRRALAELVLPRASPAPRTNPATVAPAAPAPTIGDELAAFEREAASWSGCVRFAVRLERLRQVLQRHLDRVGRRQDSTEHWQAVEVRLPLEVFVLSLPPAERRVLDSVLATGQLPAAASLTEQRRLEQKWRRVRRRVAFFCDRESVDRLEQLRPSRRRLPRRQFVRFELEVPLPPDNQKKPTTRVVGFPS